MFLVAQAEQLFGDTEAAALPALLESGRLPARISGLPASARALMAASMHAQLDAPVLAVCPDEAAAELFQKDLSALLGQDVPLLTARDYTFYTVESVSRQTEQKRLSALYALAAGTVIENTASVTEAAAAGLIYDLSGQKLNDSVSVTVTSGKGSPRTGDDSNLGLWIAVMAASLACAGAAAVIYKKRGG